MERLLSLTEIHLDQNVGMYSKCHSSLVLELIIMANLPGVKNIRILFLFSVL